MELVRIFDLPKPTLYAIHYDNEAQDEYHRLLAIWNDPEHLYTFFSENEADLTWYGIDPGTAALETYDLAGEMETAIQNACQEGYEDIGLSLQMLFKPLNNNETSTDVELQRTKAKWKWLRFYDVRIGSNCFVITGGAIKLTLEMKERPHTLNELSKIERVIDYLKDQGLYDPYDFEMLEF